jgi:uncharacterized membrane protein
VTSAPRLSAAAKVFALAAGSYSTAASEISPPEVQMAERTSQHPKGTGGSSAKASAALASVMERNIASLVERRRREEAGTGWQMRIADAATKLTGNIAFIYFHLFLFGSWVTINAGFVPMIPRWDPSFNLLGTVASVEAIFLSTFILIRQNRMAEADRKHADLDLQVSLLAEHEITKIVTLTSAIADHLGLDLDVDRGELEELKQHVMPETVLDKLDDLSE